MNGVEQCYLLFEKVGEYLETNTLAQFLDEVKDKRSILSAFENKVRDVTYFKTKFFPNVFEFSFYRLLIYSIARARHPKIIVETGVMHGLTSSFILEALKENNFGRLISIDYPSYFENGPSNKDGYHATLPPAQEPGWIVDPSNLPFWDLRIGKSSEILPNFTKAELPIDIFFHDSEHTYETMTFEMEFAWENLSIDGLLIVDNIDSNKSFFDFCRRVNKKSLSLPSPNNSYSEVVRVGLLKK